MSSYQATTLTFIGFLLPLLTTTVAFTTVNNLPSLLTSIHYRQHQSMHHPRDILSLSMTPSDDTKSSSKDIVELIDDDDDDDDNSPISTATIPPPPTFLSQGDIDKENLNIDLANPKQTRVIFYIIISLLPVLFLVPFMLSRDLVPLEELPPVQI